MAMFDLQEAYIIRFRPFSQKHLRDRWWMIRCLIRDDIEKQQCRKPPQRAASRRDIGSGPAHSQTAIRAVPVSRNVRRRTRRSANSHLLELSCIH